MSEWIITKKKSSDKMVHILGTDYYYYLKKDGKFENDKVIIDDDDLFLILDGVIFNKNNLMNEEIGKSWEELIKNLYLTEGISFIEKLRGSYNGIVLKKKEKTIKAFVDPLGLKPVFYCYLDNVISSDFNLIIKSLKNERKKYTTDIEAIKRMLYFGYMVDDRTYVKEVKRIFPGNYVEIYQDGKIQKYVYFRFTNDVVLEETNENLIELIDDSFVKAVKLQFDKDKEYGYEHLVDISGGLDARAVNFVAKKMGYKNITNICYSQMNAYEKDITEKLIRQLGNDYLFKSLDNASFIYTVDEIVYENFGLCYFAGITGGRDFLRALDKTKYGIEHTGLLGDVYEGSFSSNAIYEKPYICQKYRISKLLDIEIDYGFLDEYSENEIFLFYTRGVLAGTSTHLIRNRYFETYSPFADIDFLKLMFSIPLSKRIDEQIYLKWLKAKYPEALEVTYAKTMCKPLSGKVKRKIRVLWNVLLLKIFLPIQKKINYNSEWNYKATMNPMDYWYEKNEDVRKFVENYYNENIEYVFDEEIKQYLQIMNDKGNMIDKQVMLTVLSIYKQFLTN